MGFSLILVLEIFQALVMTVVPDIERIGAKNKHGADYKSTFEMALNTFSLHGVVYLHLTRSFGRLFWLLAIIVAIVLAMILSRGLYNDFQSQTMTRQG